MVSSALRRAVRIFDFIAFSYEPMSAVGRRRKDLSSFGGTSCHRRDGRMSCCCQKSVSTIIATENHREVVSGNVLCTSILGCVCVFSEIGQELKERRRLPDEKSHSGEKLQRSHRSTFGSSGPHYRARWQASAQEYGGLRHNQVGLEFLSTKRGRIEVREHQRGIFWVGQSRCIARFVAPGLKVHGLGGTDAENDAQNIGMGDALSERWIKAGSALLDGSKVETRSIGDCLNVVVRREVVVGPGNGRMLAHIQSGDALIEGVAEIRVLVADAIARPPTGIHSELHEVGKPPDLLRP